VKRLKDIVRIFANVNKEIKARLVMVGDGPERAGAYRLAEELGVIDRCYFLGMQESIATLLNCADLVLQPSALESFGLVILEALSMGKPVVTTRCGGPEEVVVHGECGYLSEVGDVDEMTQYCLKLLRDEELYHRFSCRARERAVENYDIHKVTELYEDFYSLILTQGETDR